MLSRPFYRDYAWAYDLIITQPISSQCDFILDMLVQRGVLPKARILDAGCGTGNYSIELAKRGYQVVGLDLSPELLAEARKKVKDQSLELMFTIGDITRLPFKSEFNAILCRGVLNDIIDDSRRRKVFDAFAQALHGTGVLIFDVREWHATQSRKRKELPKCFL